MKTMKARNPSDCHAVMHMNNEYINQHIKCSDVVYRMQFYVPALICKASVNSITIVTGAHRESCRISNVTGCDMDGRS